MRICLCCDLGLLLEIWVCQSNIPSISLRELTSRGSDTAARSWVISTAMGKHKAVAAYRYALSFIKSRVRETIHTIRNVSLDGSHEVDLAQLTQHSAVYRLHHHCSHLIGREWRLLARLGRSRQHRNHDARRCRLRARYSGDGERFLKAGAGLEKRLAARS